MSSTLKQHAGAGLVAVAVIVASLAQGLFDSTGYAAASIVIWAAVIAGLVGRALPAAPIRSLVAVAGLCLAATAILAVASIGWAGDQGRAFDEAIRVSFYLGLFVLAACTATRAARAQWLAGLGAGLALVSVLALFAYLYPGVFNSGGSDVPNAVGRLAYPLGYWNAAAALLAASVTLLAYGAVRAPARELRAAAIAVIPPAALALWLTSSRGGAAAAVLAWAVLLAASPDRPRQLRAFAIGGAGAAVLIFAATRMDPLTSGVVDSAQRVDAHRMSAFCLLVAMAVAAIAWRTDGRRIAVHLPRRVGVGVALVAAAALIAGVIAAHPADRLREFEAPPLTHAGVPVGGADLSSNGRWQFWGEALDAFASDPIGGVGAGGYEEWWARHADVALFVRNPHSLPLQQAAELGVPGIALFLGFMGALVLAGFRRLREGLKGDVGILIALVVAGAVEAAVDWTWEIPAVFASTVVGAALLLASARSRPLARHAYWLGLTTVAGAWVAMVAGGLVLLANLELQRSRDAAAAGRIDDAIGRATAAKTIQPWSSEPYTQLALLESEKANIPQALAYLKQAENRDSEDWRLPLIEASLQQTGGNLTAARMAYRRAKSLTPLSPLSIVFPPKQG